MPMLDWNDYRKQVPPAVQRLGSLTPETVRGYVALNAAGAKTGRFDERTRELMALAVAVSLRCDGCIAVHTAAARRAGATEEELGEALGVAISVNAGAAMIYSLRTLEAFSSSPAPAALESAGSGV